MRGPDYIFHRFFVKPILSLYLKSDRKASYDGFKLVVKKGVFHPLLFFTTKILYGFLDRLDVKNKKFLEIGSGSGLISLLAYRKGALVTAVDVDTHAVENTTYNFELNFGKQHGARIVRSDIFSALGNEVFDVILINPPFYFKEVEYPSQQAWYCGKDGAYFTRLFAALGKHTDNLSQVYMILEENCEIERIKDIALKHGTELELQTSEKMKWERSFIFRVKRN